MNTEIENIIKLLHEKRLEKFAMDTTIGEDRYLHNFIDEQLPNILKSVYLIGAKHELSLLRTHLDKQVGEQTIYTASIYEYVNSGLKYLEEMEIPEKKQKNPGVD